MGVDFSDTLVVAISATALFELSDADAFYRSCLSSDSDSAVERYREYMLQREEEFLEDGTGMPLVRALLGLNEYADESQPLVEVVVLSRNSPETGVRVWRSIRNTNLPITRTVFTGGESVVPYLEAFSVDLFLTTSRDDAQRVIDSKLCAAAILEPRPENTSGVSTSQVRIAFDGDAVLFDESSELVFKTQGLDAFQAHEDERSEEPLAEGPYAIFLKKLATLQAKIHTLHKDSLIRIALITARNAPAELRVVNTLRCWGVQVDTVCFLGGMSKAKVLKAFNPHIFFDDQRLHLQEASKIVSAGKVPYPSTSKLKEANDE